MSTEEKEPSAILSAGRESAVGSSVPGLSVCVAADRRPVGAPWCEPDKCPAAVCGGPHYEVQTDLGVEIVRADQSPVGAVPDSTKTENHGEAWSNPR